MSIPPRLVQIMAVLMMAAAAALPAAAQNTSASTSKPLKLEKEGSFFVGGRDVQFDTLSPSPNIQRPARSLSIRCTSITKCRPGAKRHYPLTLIHGCCLTGKTWETTPDGRMGWDEYFARKGFPVYVVDQAWRGRSACSPAAINAVKANKAPLDQLPVRVLGRARRRLGDLPLRSGISEGVPRHAVPAGGAGGILEADGDQTG